MRMNEEVIADLKQFIAATISQQLSDVATKDDISKLERKIDDLQESVAGALETANDAVDAQLNEHVRIYHQASA